MLYCSEPRVPPSPSPPPTPPPSPPPSPPELICDNSCRNAYSRYPGYPLSALVGVCDDNGPIYWPNNGTVRSFGTGLCPCGTDCSDCGPRPRNETTNELICHAVEA
eukprot:336979-Prymnesium_polylepis.1